MTTEPTASLPTEAIPGQRAPEPSGPTKPKWYRRKATHLAAAGLLGLMIGSSGGDDQDATITTLRSDVAASEEKADGWKTRAEAIESDLQASQKRVSDLETELAAARKAAAEAESKAAAAVAPVAPAPAEPAPAAPAAEPEPAVQDAYYANCAEARAAGAAPIRAGEPGYRKGLDRDGDGVACDK
jgi:septal ring factor EnvC (AmiA/AmiB activator)